MSVQAEYKNRNPRGYWFSPETMRFFRCRVSDRQHWNRKLDRWVFVSSECPPWGSRAYTVRVMDRRGEIHTVGQFCQMTASVAHRHARELAQGQTTIGLKTFRLVDFGRGRRARKWPWDRLAPPTARGCESPRVACRTRGPPERRRGDAHAATVET